MSEDRDRMISKNEDEETTTDEDVEAHRLAAANEEPDSGDDDVEAHRLA
ncbi:MAG TPA: hypothetical protein VHV52_03525 [Gaiellaceae bacterium]|jgi:hypothetical protein|nr:hypothetical protein [Gaiellaceae bacterium]